MPINDEVKQPNLLQYDNLTLRHYSDLPSVPMEDQMLNRLTSKFMQFGSQKPLAEENMVQQQLRRAPHENFP
jgi:hypothetical protein